VVGSMVGSVIGSGIGEELLRSSSTSGGRDGIETIRRRESAVHGLSTPPDVSVPG
jgi:hypothetical protein